jgi:cell division protein FtsW (lipid II flippase)
LGLIFCLFIVALFCWLAWRGIKIAAACGDKFLSLAAAGLTNLIILQAAINLLVVLDLLPNTGLPLPFISYGGSALLFNLISVGLIINISRHCGLADEGAGISRLAPTGETQPVQAAAPGPARSGGRALRPRGF